jgi:hypothetical protein
MFFCRRKYILISFDRPCLETAVDGVGRPGRSQADDPDDDTDRDPDRDPSAGGRGVEGRQTAVDAEGDEGQDRSILVGFPQGVGHSARRLPERPVAGVGGEAEEGKRQNEQLIGGRQVQDVVVGHGPVPTMDTSHSVRGSIFSGPDPQSI